MRARVALVIVLMGLMWGIGVDQTPPAARVWLTAAGIWLSLLGGVWMGRRSLLRKQSAVQKEDSSLAAHQPPSASGLDGRAFNAQPPGQAVASSASSGKEGVSEIARLVRAWVEQRLTLPRPGGHFVPPSVMPSEDLARLEQMLVRALREANAVQARIRAPAHPRRGSGRSATPGDCRAGPTGTCALSRVAARGSPIWGHRISLAAPAPKSPSGGRRLGAWG
jgi:hypothetical protein